MLSFCKKIIHSLFNISFTTSFSAEHHCPTPPPVGGGVAGLGILAASSDIRKPKNVIESSSVIKLPAKSDVIRANDVIESSQLLQAKREPGGIGLSFLDGGVGGVVDGFSSCTESLGFESSNEMSNINKLEIEELEKLRELNRSSGTGKSRKVAVKKEVKQLPPPLSTFNNDGRPSFILRPVRKDGRLELIEVKINRPEGLLVSRENGRLRLHRIPNKVIDNTVDDHAADVKGKKKVEEEMQTPANNCGGGDDCRRLHEMSVSHNHNHNMHGWGQRCVTTR